MPAITWIQGKDLVTVNLAAGGGIDASVLTVPLVAGETALLPAAPFYVFFPGNVGVGETPEFIYVTSKSGDNLLLGAPPFGNTGGTGRAALRNDIYTATSHPGGAVLELRSTFEMFQQLQTQMGAHEHTGGTGDGAIIQTAAIADNAITTNKLGANVVTAAKIANATITATQIANNTITATQLGAASATGAVLGTDVVVVTGAQTIAGNKTFTGNVIANNGIQLVNSFLTDHTYDMWYRSSAGYMYPIAGPTEDDMILGNASGVPVWRYAPREWSRALIMAGT